MIKVTRQVNANKKALSDVSIGISSLANSLKIKILVLTKDFCAETINKIVKMHVYDQLDYVV